MTTDTRGPLAQRVGALRFQRYLGMIASAFGLLYGLQTLDALVAGWPTMAGAFGGAAVALVAGSVLIGTVAGFVPGRARSLFLSASLLFVLAVAVWPLSITGPVPVAPMPWFIGMLPVEATYLAVAFRRPSVPTWCALLLTVVISIVLVVRGGLSPTDALANALFGVAVSVVLVILIAAVRRGVERADAAQQAALAGYGRSRLDDATESERVRTDALVHDSVLTTFLAAAASREPETEELARRMAANALRVLAHVTRTEDIGPAVPFGKVLGDSADRFDPLLPDWDMEIGSLADLVLPVHAAETVVASMLNAMAASVLHAAGTTRRTIRMTELGPDGIRIVLSDDGHGFDPRDDRDARRPLLREVVDLMRGIDGRADVRTSSDSGTVVTLSWGSVVVTAAAPKPARSGGLGMIVVPRWFSAGIASAIAAYTAAFAIINIATGRSPFTDLLALCCFGLAFGLCIARTGRAPVPTTVVVLAAGLALPLLGSAGLDPVKDSYSSGAWYVSGVACLVVVLLWRRRSVRQASCSRASCCTPTSGAASTR